MVQAFTQGPVKLDVKKGGKFELFGGNIHGEFVEVVSISDIRSYLSLNFQCFKLPHLRSCWIISFTFLVISFGWSLVFKGSSTKDSPTLEEQTVA